MIHTAAVFSHVYAFLFVTKLSVYLRRTESLMGMIEDLEDSIL